MTMNIAAWGHRGQATAAASLRAILFAVTAINNKIACTDGRHGYIKIIIK